MESVYSDQNYSLLAISRFNLYILETTIEDNTSFKKIYFLKSQDVIQAATLEPASYHHPCHVIVASKSTLWSISVPDGNSDNDNKPNGPSNSKRRKLSGESADHEDIFADLLDQGDTQQSQELNSFQRELSTQQNVYSLSINERHRLCSVEAEITDIAVSGEVLVALVLKEHIAYIKVFVLQGGNARCIQSFPTGIEAKSFHPDFISSSAKLLHLVLAVDQQENFAKDSKKAHTSSQILNIPTNLFILLFGKEAACLKSQVVLVSDTKGCVYFYKVKSLMLQPERLKVLCETNSPVVCISRVDFYNWPEKKALTNGGAISLLESALGNDKKDQRHEEAFPISGLLTVSETGQCCMFLPHKFSREVLIFYLPHSTQSCIVKGNCVFYSTDKGVEVCEIVLSRKDDNTINVAAEKKSSFFTEKDLRLVSISRICDPNKDVIIGVSNELKVVHLPVSQEKQGVTPRTASNLNSLVDSNIKCILNSSEDIRAAQTLVDSCLLQLNLFASIVRQRRAVSRAEVLKSEEIVVTCDCSFLSRPSICLQVKLTNNTHSSFTRDWKVDVCFGQKAESEAISTASRHFVFPFPQGLPPKSTKEIFIPISTSSVSSLKPYDMSVSLVFTPEVALSTGYVQKTLFVKVYEGDFNVMDYLQTFSSTDLTSSIKTVDERTSQNGGNTISSELAKCLLTIPRTLPCKSYGEELKQIGTSPTFALTLLVPQILCKKPRLQAAEDILRLLMAQDKITGAAKRPTLSQIQLKTPDDIPMSVAISESCGSNDVKQEQNVSAYSVTLRSSSLLLLMATRASIKARLKKKAHSLERNRNEIPVSSRVKLNQQLQRCERLADELMVKSSKSFQEKNLHEDIDILCDLFDKYELI
ncbi:hypothetical protein ElyMa_000373400 [Elysia marginata]|uniref:Uncharacterized protein n=1 Tax=Elysia marginata TaxID=1093978 RepID=A0AAV4FFX3_9GAST|nr:hypothetical protein ElyMa_000373400 [Elysia marginata]